MQDCKCSRLLHAAATLPIGAIDMPCRSSLLSEASFEVLDYSLMLLGRGPCLESAELVIAPLSSFIFLRRIQSILA
jgi:hypothetical protein